MPAVDAQATSPPITGRYASLALLTITVVLCNIDRGIIAILFEPIRKEFALQDWQLGLLSGFGFTLFYSFGSIVIARRAERRNRVGILALAVAGWSAMTMVCALAGSYVQLLAARMGVGLTEAGCQPSCHALIADLFSARERPLAMGVFAAGSVSGLLVSFPLGGLIAQAYGWRAALLLVGLPGLVLAIGLKLLMRDPRSLPHLSRQSAPHARRSDAGEPWTAAMKQIWDNRVLRHAILGSVLITIATSPSTSFGPAYLMRRFAISEAQAGLQFGLLTGTAALLGNLGYGWLTAALLRKGPAWGMLVPAIASCAHIPATLVFLLSSRLDVALAGITVSSVIAVGWMAATYATVQSAAGVERRATAAACLMTAYTLLGFGLGPLIAGVVSDLLKPWLGETAIRGGLLAAMPFSLWAVLHYGLAARALARGTGPADFAPASPRPIHP
ncbi:putative MFS family arabinose efflux permease [Novosphingobium sp. 1529]|uniref:spinster family MFS transporter n=1 Tax=Novosphingobium sp. 1529 TaxID=3156424 RepID=UPI00149457F2